MQKNNNPQTVIDSYALLCKKLAPDQYNCSINENSVYVNGPLHASTTEIRTVVEGRLLALQREAFIVRSRTCVFGWTLQVLYVVTFRRLHGYAKSHGISHICALEFTFI